MGLFTTLLVFQKALDKAMCMFFILQISYISGPKVIEWVKIHTNEPMGLLYKMIVNIF